MASVNSRAQPHSQGKLRLKRWVFRQLWKTGSDCADVTWCGRLFKTREVATGKAVDYAKSVSMPQQPVTGPHFAGLIGMVITQPIAADCRYFLPDPQLPFQPQSPPPACSVSN